MYTIVYPHLWQVFVSDTDTLSPDKPIREITSRNHGSYHFINSGNRKPGTNGTNHRYIIGIAWGSNINHESWGCQPLTSATAESMDRSWCLYSVMTSEIHHESRSGYHIWRVGESPKPKGFTVLRTAPLVFQTKMPAVIRRPRQTQGGARQGIRQAKTSKFRHTTTRRAALERSAAAAAAAVAVVQQLLTAPNKVEIRWKNDIL